MVGAPLYAVAGPCQCSGSRKRAPGRRGAFGDHGWILPFTPNVRHKGCVAHQIAELAIARDLFAGLCHVAARPARSVGASAIVRHDCAPGSPLDIVIVALAQTIRRFFDAVEQFALTTLRCDSRDPDWLAFESALRTLRKSIGFRINALANSYSIPLQGEFAAYLPQGSNESA